MSSVQPLVKPLGKPLVVIHPLFQAVWFGIPPMPFLELLFPLAQFVLRNGIAQPECDEVSAVCLPPVRKMPRINANGIFRMEWAEK